MQEQSSFWVWPFVLNIGHVFLILQMWRTFELRPWHYECDAMGAHIVFYSSVELSETQAIKKNDNPILKLVLPSLVEELSLHSNSGVNQGLIKIAYFWCFPFDAFQDFLLTFQYTEKWDSLIAQLVKNTPAMQETLGWFLDRPGFVSVRIWSQEIKNLTAKT